VSLYSRSIRAALFALDPERAHDIALAALSSSLGKAALGVGRRVPRDSRLRQQLLGLTFDNPLGLAAGLDKQGTATPAWEALGFGFAEVGTVTLRPQPGNPRPRLFRLPEDNAIINRFGFNSTGAEAVARNLTEAGRASIPIGVNIGRNKDTPNERAADDYVRAIDALHARADYIAVNVSSPNTTGLRDLQEVRSLRDLLTQVVDRVDCVSPSRTIPVLVKVSPDLTPAELLAAVDAALEGGASGVIATNTTIRRSGLRTRTAVAQEAGGLSGAPLRAAANDACRLLFKHLGRRVPIVGVGGICGVEDAYERIRAGATLVQLYTGFIYQGPAIVTDILTGLSERLARDGFANVHDAIGVDVE
jgi:dihydroorotate dehydrogenase